MMFLFRLLDRSSETLDIVRKSLDIDCSSPYSARLEITCAMVGVGRVTTPTTVTSVIASASDICHGWLEWLSKSLSLFERIAQNE